MPEVRKNTTPEDWSRFNTESLLGGCLVDQKRFKEAEPILLSSYEGLKAREKSVPAFHKIRITVVLRNESPSSTNSGARKTRPRSGCSASRIWSFPTCHSAPLRQG